MSDLINRDELIVRLNRVKKTYKIDDRVIGTVSGMPAVDAESVRYGRWVPNKRYDGCMVCDRCGFGIGINTIVLMECNRRSDEREFSICAGVAELAYCPSCGAKMDGGK